MKKLLNLLYAISTSMGQTRAASALARAGMYAEAKALMTK